MSKRGHISISTVIEGVKALASVKRWQIGEAFHRDVVRGLLDHNRAIMEMNSVVTQNANLLNDLIKHVGFEVKSNGTAEDKISESEQTGQGEEEAGREGQASVSDPET